MLKESAKRDVIEGAKLCAEQGWKGTYRLISGEVIEGAYVTGTDWDKQFIALEKVGERHLPATLLDLRDVASVEPSWS
jgi:hypothetical protein